MSTRPCGPKSGRLKLSEHHANPALAHHFEDADQQFEASTLGMWTFLVTEIMFFGGLFLGYIVYRSLYPVAFAEASNLLNYRLGAINTAILICSSLTMVLAVRAAQLSHRRSLIVFLLLTIILGSVFLVNKAVEYAHKFHEHLVPGPNFGPAAALTDPQHSQLFFSFYFGMTGLHALHMIIGIGILLTLVFQARQGRFSADYFTPVDITGLYWHFVDIVWIFLFPLLYLISRT
jgi:cytochrome c oxidase subunit 3